MHYMQQGYLRHIGFWPDASCLVLCSALRCAALPSRSALLGLDFPTRPSSAPVLNHLTFHTCLFLLVPLLYPAPSAVDPLGSSLQSSLSHGCRLAPAANLLRSVLASLELESRRHFHPPRSSTSISHPSRLDNCDRPHRSYQSPEQPYTSLDSLSLILLPHTAASLSLERLGTAFCASHHSTPASCLPPLSHTALVASNGWELSTETQFTCKNSTVTIAVAGAITTFFHILESLGSSRAKHPIRQ